MPGVWIDIERDPEGEVFCIRALADPAGTAEILVRDLRPSERHLLLDVRTGTGRDRESGCVLCGFDERHWFAAVVPAWNARTVAEAREALKPPLVQRAELHAGVRPQDRQKRRNRAFVRQGEWFFLPVRGLEPPRALVLRHAPLRREGGGRPHQAEWLYRRETPGYRAAPDDPVVLAADLGKRTGPERPFAPRDPRIALSGFFVRGRVTHPDHRTVVLDDWHLAVPNTEARGALGVEFRD
ncbi:MAG: hypothetical protein GF330_12505 [Candidatus Eisenbacteria bacterium]|nr:hypothetical protein [Candidatus Eisenbacteria bacterium]